MANDTSEQKRGESDVSVSKCKFCSWMWRRSVSGVLSSLLKRKIFTQIYQTLNIWINYSLWVIKTHKKMTTTSSSTQLQIVITYQSWNAMVRSILKDLIQSRLADVGGRLGVKTKASRSAARSCCTLLMMNFVMERCFCRKMNVRTGPRRRVMRLLLLCSLTATHCQHGPVSQSHSSGC